MKWFHSFDTTDWTRVSVIVAAATAFWIGLAAIMPEDYYRIGTTILGAAQSALTLMMRSGKSRGEIIGDKIEEHQADAEKKSEQIKTLVANELKEKAAEKLEDK